MSGDRDNPDRNFVCQSDPRSECAVPTSRPGAPSLAHVYFYYHPAATDTTYTGTIDIGFFEGAADSHVIRPNISVKGKEEDLGHESIVGIVSSKPGTYFLTLAVVATSVPTGATEEFHDRIAVVVK
jgi:hypothetical protein